MAVFVKFRQFVEDLCKGEHNFTDDTSSTVTLALCAAANAPVNTNSVLADLTQATYTNLSSRVVTGITCEQTTGTVTCTATDLVLTSTGGSTGPFRYIIAYNDDTTTPTDALIGYWDYGSDVTLADGETFTVDFSASGLFTLA